MSVLDNDEIRRQIRRAWEESAPGTTGAHEEGGFVLKAADGSLTVERWPCGIQDRIELPSHVGGQRGGSIIVATFHTHPNFGPDFLQEPSLTDIRAVRDDPNLSHAEYEGEYVVSSQLVFRIRRDGTVEVLGKIRVLLEISNRSANS